MTRIIGNLIIAAIIGGYDNGTTNDPPSGGIEGNPFVDEWRLNTEAEKPWLNFYDPEFAGQMPLKFYYTHEVFLNGLLQDGDFGYGTYIFNGNTADISIDGTTSRATIGADDKLIWQGTVYTRTANLSGTLTISPSNPAKGQTLTANYSGSEPIIYQ